MRLFFIQSMFVFLSLFNAQGIAADGETEPTGERKEGTIAELCAGDILKQLHARKAPIMEVSREIGALLTAIESQIHAVNSTVLEETLTHVIRLVMDHGWNPVGVPEAVMSAEQIAVADGAHDLKNALQNCINQNKLLSLAAVGEGKVLRDSIEANIAMGREILAEMENPGKTILKRKIPLLEFVEKAKKVLGAHDARYHMRFEDPPVGYAVHANMTQLLRVVQNLVSNSMQAMPDGGNITVAVTISDKKQLRDFREHVVISVSDNGPGFLGNALSEARNRKQEGAGDNSHGGGTTSVHNIMEDLDGGMDYANLPTGGARVELYLKAIPPQQNIVKQIEIPHNAALIVDDEKDGRDSFALLIRAVLKIPSVPLASADQLFAAIEQASANIRVIALDANLKDGTTLAANVKRIRELGYTGPIVLMSGEGMRGDALPEGIVARWLKPVVFDEIGPVIEAHAPALPGKAAPAAE